MIVLLSNLVIMGIIYMGYILIRNREDKCMFSTGIISRLWLRLITPIIGVLANTVVSKYDNVNNKYYVYIAGVYLLVLLVEILSGAIISKKEISYYNANISKIKDKIDTYLNSMSLTNIYKYQVVFTRNSNDNRLIIYMKNKETLDEIEFLLHKEELEELLSEYKMTVLLG